jgi:hypothetical protein
MRGGESKIELGMNSSRRDIMKKVAVFQMVMVLFLCMNLAVPPGLMAQGNKGETTQEGAPAFRPEEIDQLTAPIALYPDSLLAQVLAASTYPLEIVQAARFLQQNKELKGEKLLAASKDKDWEPSVKAMLEFPDVLLMMNEKLEWTQKLGDAFLGQQKDVMVSVQRLRQKAQEAGNLKTTKEQKVIVEEQTKVIIIQSASPEVVYVPTYNPTVVYGAWPYPAYPPYYYYPPGYVAGGALLAFGVGVAIGAAWSGHGGWGCGWGNNEININASRQNNFTKNNYNRPEQHQNKGQNWQHNPQNRGGAQYKNQATAQKYGQQRSGSGGRATTSEARGYGGGAGDRGGGRAQTSDLSRGGGRDSAFGGSDRGGSERASSNRGNESRSSASRSSGSGASRSSGGASRSSGGSRGGGGRR